MTIRLNHLLLLFWLIAISIIYYTAFSFVEIFAGLPDINTFRPSFAILEHLLILSFILISANGWGAFIWFNAELSHLERLVFATATGLGIISFLVFFLGLIGFVNSPLYFLVLMTGFIMLVASGKQIHARTHPGLGLLALAALVPLTSTLIGALAPPTQFDSLVYHLALPSRYIQAGKYFAVPHNIFFSFPQNIEMLYQMAMKLDSDIAANLIHWSFFPLTAAAIYSLSKRFADKTTALIAPLIWLFTPAAMFVSTGTYVDLGLAFYAFAALYAFLLWQELKGKRYLVYCAVFSGLACGTKYTAAVNVVALAVLILLARRRHSHGSQPPVNGPSIADRLRAFKYRDCAKYLIVTLLVLSPWLIKNLIFANNPVSPWATGFFSDTLVTKAQAGAYFSHIGGHGISIEGVMDFLRLPFDLTFTGYKFGGGFDILGPVFLLFLPALFLGIKIDKIDKILLIYSVIFLVLWLLTGKVMRFLLPVLPALCILTARGIEAFTGPETHKYIRFLLYALLAAAFTHNIMIYHWTMASVDPYSVVTGRLTKSEYLSGKLNYYRAASGELNKLPKGSKTVFLGETRSYYSLGDIIAPTDFDPNPLIVHSNAAPDDRGLLEKLRSEGITHIFVNNYEFDRLSVKAQFTEQGLRNWEALKNNLAGLAHKDNYCQIYELHN